MTTGSNDIEIANEGTKTDTGTIRIGTAGKQHSTYLAGVYGVSIAGPSKAVVVNANGRLGTTTTTTSSSVSSAGYARLQAEVKRQARELRQLMRLVHRHPKR